MSSRKFALVLLSTTVFGLLPMSAAAAVTVTAEEGKVTLDDSAIKSAQEDSDKTFKLKSDAKDVTISPNTTLKSDSLTIDSSASESAVFTGTLYVVGSDGNTPTLNTNIIGKFPNTTQDIDASGNLDWRKWTTTNVTGWKNSENGSNNAAIIAQNAVLNLTDSVFAGSNNKDSDEHDFGGAVFVGNGATLTSELNIYYSNTTTTDGGAVLVSSTNDNTFYDDYFVKNSAGGSGGAIDVFGNVDSIARTIFGANTAKWGGAISVENGGNIGSIKALFDENKATGDNAQGGAIYNKGTIGSIYQATFSNNSATDSGGAIYNGGTIDSITNTLFSNNSATNGGALVLDNNASAEVTNSDFLNNTVTSTTDSVTGFGGAIAIHHDLGSGVGNTLLKTTGNVFTGNEVKGNAALGGAAVYNDNGTWMSVNDTFTSNTSSTNGGAIGSNGNTTLVNATIVGNTAKKNGGGVFARNSNGPAQTDIVNGVIFNNTAAVGGGLANVNIESYANRSNVNIDGTVILGNQAVESSSGTGHGGGIYNAQDLNAKNVRVQNNTAVSGAGIYNDQGGVAVIDGNTTISGNEATGNGGGIYNNGELTIQGSGVTIQGNTAALGQNLYNDDSGVVTIDGADDQIDLNYKPYPDSTTPRPAGELHTLFDQSQDIYNRGRMEITNSNLQLHQGINTGAELTSDSERKVGTVNITGSTVDLGGSNVEGAGVMYGDEVNINANSTIKTHVSKEPDGNHGRISANDINVAQDNTTLDVVISAGTLAKGEKKDYQILDGNITGEFTDFGEHANYRTRALGDGNYEVYRRDKNACPGCDQNEVNTNDGWLDGDDITQNSDALDIQRKLFEVEEGQREALDGLAPDVSPLIQAHATEITQRLASIVSDRFYESMDRTGYIHRGKRFYRFPRHDSNLWVQGLYGKSKYDVRKGWDMDNRGISVGFDGHVNDAVRLGVAYAYTKSSGESVQRDTDIKSHTGMIYGNYNPNRFYANWLAMYTRSKYDEDKKVFNHHVKANYNVDAFGAQVMFGQKMGPYVNDDWATGVIKPEIGARYVYTKQHSYTDTVGQSVGSADGNTLTGILGAQYTIGYTLSPTLSWYPELRAALTYDFIEPDTKMHVNLLNGSVYEVKTENMDRFGIEVGARIGLDINRKAEVAIEYEGLFKGDYTNHTGLANLKYKF